ncbi:MAG: dephospho-CoA kinase [Clostridiaceae bacterium]|nr:dephospho-CoA kinase [Clostridiaceae bacterium]
MLTIGVTGGIGTGKSTVARILERIGAKLVIADDVAKEIVKRGMPAYEKIVSEFGDEILDRERNIDRKKLGNIVFADKSRLSVLNQITHGIVAEEIRLKLEQFMKENSKLVVIEAIVPIKHGFLDLVDSVWVVIAPEAVRIERIVKRNGVSCFDAKQRIRSQMSDEEYKSIADKVIYNDGSFEELEAKVWDILKDENYSMS